MTLRAITPEEAQKRLAEHPLYTFSVDWFKPLNKDAVEELNLLLQTARREGDFQRYLEKYPALLIKHLGGGHGRWVIPKLQLGNQFVTDFLIAEKDSMGYHWKAIELEGPVDCIFTKSGDPSNELTHAYRQISDWRRWLLENRDYAIRARSESGLGLTAIEGNIPGIIVIGRRSSLSDETNARRKQFSKEWNVEIHTYDWFLDQLKS